MTSFKEWLAKSRWALWAFLGVCAVVALGLLKAFLDIKPKGAVTIIPEVPKALQEKVHKAEEDGLRVRIEANVRADEQKKQLVDVLKIDDGAERRKRLAELASKV